MITNHEKLRRVLEWAFPQRMKEIEETWDGTEDKQVFLDRAVIWSSSPVTAVEIEAKEVDYDNHMTSETLQNAKNSARGAVKAALISRFDQGVLWKWNNGSAQYAIPLDSANREFLTHMKIDLAAGEINPHDGYLKFNGAKLLASNGGDLTDAAVIEICRFCSLWGQKISRIAISEKASIDAMDLATVQAYDASAINWSVTWIGHSDWTNDLVLHIPNT